MHRFADQLFRVTTHPAAVQLPVEGSLPSLAGATEWLNSPPLTAAACQLGLRVSRSGARNAVSAASSSSGACSATQ